MWFLGWTGPFIIQRKRLLFYYVRVTKEYYAKSLKFHSRSRAQKIHGVDPKSSAEKTWLVSACCYTINHPRYWPPTDNQCIFVSLFWPFFFVYVHFIKRKWGSYSVDYSVCFPFIFPHLLLESFLKVRQQYQSPLKNRLGWIWKR